MSSEMERMKAEIKKMFAGIPNVKIITGDSPVTWDGAGLPPVGCECELVNFYGEDFPAFVGEAGEKVKIIGNGFTNSRPVAFYEADGGRGSMLAYAVANCFRPILTEAERRRDQLIVDLTMALTSLPRDQHVIDWAEALVNKIAAGKIPGIRLTDDAGS
ncbi:hypothetical protein [Erwinia phyllosphaerae]|uniref:hypothetical protein n=1 Tax=Erwinia phyllosphaerae TaxID=2853256 RepID=UPI001FF01F18|nr:hypothetical protein [Erwinia phyllosphaerae]MBV4365870.1 hypothetical protein [Erwinia phyllosphaerae]